MFEPIDTIKARWVRDGQVLPENFTTAGKTWQVDSTGRSWRDGEGLHILCTVLGGSQAELLLSPDFGWQVRWFPVSKMV